MHGGTYRALHVCPHCQFAHEGVKAFRQRRQPNFEPAATATAFEPAPAPTHIEPIYGVVEETAEAPTFAPVTANDVVLTTKSDHEHTVVNVVSEVQAENAVMVAITPDMISDGKFTGSKSESVQAALKQARQNALAQLREEASQLGANLVEAIEVKSGLKLADKQNAKVSVKAVGQAVQAELAEVTEA